MLALVLGLATSGALTQPPASSGRRDVLHKAAATALATAAIASPRPAHALYEACTSICTPAAAHTQRNAR